MDDQEQSQESRIPPRVQPAIGKKQAKWPLVLGIIVLVLAGFASLSSIAGILVTLMQLEEAGGELGYEAERAIYEQAPVIAWLGWIIGGACLLLLWGFGIGLIKRRRWGVSLGRGLGVLILFQVLLSICGAYYRFPVMDEQFQDMPGGQSIRLITLASIGFGFLINIVVSVAILSWLGSARAKKEWQTWT